MRGSGGVHQLQEQVQEQRVLIESLQAALARVEERVCEEAQKQASEPRGRMDAREHVAGGEESRGAVGIGAEAGVNGRGVCKGEARKDGRGLADRVEALVETTEALECKCDTLAHKWEGFEAQLAVSEGGREGGGREGVWMGGLGGRGGGGGEV